MLRKSKLKSIAVAMAILVASTGSSFANSTSYTNSKVNGSNINYVTINMKDPTMKSVILNANNEISATDQLANMAKGVNAIAAVNGTYFEAYDGEPLPWGTIIKDQKILHIGNTGSVAGITEDNKLIIDNLTIAFKIYINDVFRGVPWRINHPSIDSEAITIFTPEYKKELNLGPEAKHIVVKNNVVTEISNKVLKIPSDGFIISYNPGVANLVEGRYKLGDHVEYTSEFKTTHTSPEDWSKVVNAIGAGPSLIINGKVTANGEQEGFWEAKINTNKATRSFIGSTKDGKIIIGTIPSATLKEAAAICQSLNLVNAMCLDGGGSTALYYQGKGAITQGRAVNNGIAFIKAEPKPIEIGIDINGSKVGFNNNTGKPYIDVNGRTQVPLRVTMESLGAKVSWDDATKTAFVDKDGKAISIAIGQKHILVDGVKVENDTVAEIKDNKTYLPIRVVVEALGYEVRWDAIEKIVGIHHK